MSEAIRSELPRALADHIPGCLVSRGKDSVVLFSYEEAKPIVPARRKGFICDRPNARHGLGNNAIGDSMEPIALCPHDLLRRFGFRP